MSGALVAQVALAWAAIVASVSLEAARRSWLRARASSHAARASSPRALLDAPIDKQLVAPRPRVLVVRPSAGDEPGLAHNLCSLADAHTPFELRCRLAVADVSDAAFPVAQRAASELAARGLDARVVLTAARGPNRKVSQLHHVLVAEDADSFDIVLVADSDVDLASADLGALVAPLCGPSPADATWAPPAEHGPALTAGDRASHALLGASLHAFPLLAGLDRRGLVGKLFAVRCAALGAIGGFGALAEHLGEDMELARRLLARGGRIEDAPLVARSMASGRSMEQVVARFARWLMVIRAQRPSLLASYPALFFATPLILLLALLGAPAAPVVALAAATLATLARLGVAFAAARAAGRSPSFVSSIHEAILGDLLLARAFVRALGTRQVTWRGTQLIIEPGGVLRERA